MNSAERDCFAPLAMTVKGQCKNRAGQQVNHRWVYFNFAWFLKKQKRLLAGLLPAASRLQPSPGGASCQTQQAMATYGSLGGGSRSSGTLGHNRGSGKQTDIAAA